MKKQDIEKELGEKVKHYRKLTQEALSKVSINVPVGHGMRAVAEDFMGMAKNYFSDAKHFEEKGELLTALAAYSYAHAWLDAGVRAKIFDACRDDRLFTLP